MNNLIVNIISYLKYLNNNCDLNVSLHFDEHIINSIPQNIFSQLLPYNYHTNAYCLMAKSKNHSKCIINQKNILKKLQNGIPFCNVCHAEVYEYIYPVFKDNCIAGFISVSGYRQKNPDERNILNYDLWKDILKSNPPLELFEAIIPPLAVMTEQLLQTYSKNTVNEYSMLVHFLNEYHTNITLADLAVHFGRSTSHISHLFKKESGMTIRAYCNQLKLEDAKKLLLNTGLSITEIALDSGFNDTSYFIHLFKNKFKITPLQYRMKKNI